MKNRKICLKKCSTLFLLNSHSDIRDSRTNDQRRHETIYTDIRHSDLHLRDSHRDSHLLREDQGHSPIITSPHSTLKSVRNEDYRYVIQFDIE